MESLLNKYSKETTKRKSQPKKTPLQSNSVPSIDEPLLLDSSEKRERWLAQRASRYWKNDSCMNYKPEDRMWVRITATNHLAMLDPQLIIDENGLLIHRLIYQINADGTINNDHGYPKIYRNIFPKTQFVERLSPKKEAELDQWFKSIQECIIKTESNGFKFLTMEYTPLDLSKYVENVHTLTQQELLNNMRANLMHLLSKQNM